MSHFIKPDSVNSYISGICNQLEYYFPNIRLHWKTPLIKCTMTSGKHMYGSPHRCQHTLTPADLETMMAHYPIPSHDDLLFCSLLQTRFSALMCLRKLIDSDSPKLHDPHKTIQHSLVESTTNTFLYFSQGTKATISSVEIQLSFQKMTII